RGRSQSYDCGGLSLSGALASEWVSGLQPSLPLATCTSWRESCLWSSSPSFPCSTRRNPIRSGSGLCAPSDGKEYRGLVCHHAPPSPAHNAWRGATPPATYQSIPWHVVRQNVSSSCVGNPTTIACKVLCP